jgi:hypothetical protein
MSKLAMDVGRAADRAKREARDEAWLTKIACIHVALFGCLDDGATADALALARKLSGDLVEAVTEAERTTRKGNGE